MKKPCVSPIVVSEDGSPLEKDGFDYLDQAPPDLEGFAGTTFTVAAHVDIQSRTLLDILADKPQATHKGQSAHVSREPSWQSAPIMPLEVEWNS